MYTVGDDDVGYIKHVYIDNLTPYSIPFMFHTYGDLEIRFEGVTGDEEILQYEKDFTSGTIDGVIYITLDPAYFPPEPSGHIVCERKVPLAQPLVIPPGKEVPRKPLEFLLDRIVWMLQRFLRGDEDFLKRPFGDETTDQLPPADGRANGVWVFDEDGNSGVAHYPPRFHPADYMDLSYQTINSQEEFIDYHKIGEISVLTPYIEARMFQQLLAENWEEIDPTLPNWSARAILPVPARDVEDGHVALIIAGVWDVEDEINDYYLYYLYKDHSVADTGVPAYRPTFNMSMGIVASTMAFMYIGSPNGELARLGADWDMLFSGEPSEATWGKVVYGDVGMPAMIQFGQIEGVYRLRRTADADDDEVSWTDTVSPIPESVFTCINTGRRGGLPLFCAFGRTTAWGSNDGLEWTQLSQFGNASNRRSCCYSEYYQGFFSYGAEVFGDNVEITIDYSADLSTWVNIYHDFLETTLPHYVFDPQVNEDFGGVVFWTGNKMIIIHEFGKYGIEPSFADQYGSTWVPSLSAYVAGVLTELRISKAIDPLTFPERATVNRRFRHYGR